MGDTLALMAHQVELLERAQATVVAGQLDAVYEMVQLALNTRAFVSDPDAPEARQVELAFRSVRAEIVTTLQRSEREVDRLISDGLALREYLPATLTALREGQIGFGRARVIIDEAALLSGASEAATDAVTEFDRRMADKALTQPAARLRRAARRLREQLCPTTIEERFATASTERRVAFEAADDGMAWLHLYLPVVEARMIIDRADNIARQLQHIEKGATRTGAALVPGGYDGGDGGDGGDGNAEGDASPACAPPLSRRTLQQLRVDVMRDMLLENMPANLPAPGPGSGAGKSTVRITIPALSLLGLSDQPASLDGYGAIDIATARRIAAQAPSFQRVITDPITSTVLDIDRRAHDAPADLKRWLEFRDETCRFPACNAPAARSELDHTIDWARGGPSNHDNLAHLCLKHHHLKHETAWQVAQLPAGVLRWVSPLGRIHYTHPATEMREPEPPPPRTSFWPDPDDSPENEPAPF